MPNINDGATGSAEGNANKAKDFVLKKCKWSNCEGHEKDLDPDYKQGNVARNEQQVRVNLLANSLEPWNGGGHGETNIRKMYLERRADGTVTIKPEAFPYRIEAHHLVPVEQVDSTSTMKANAEFAGWDINHTSNGMFLPRDAADVALHLLQQHNGSHPGGYTVPISEELEAIESAYEDACHGVENVDFQLGLAQELQLLSMRIRTQILNIRQYNPLVPNGIKFMEVHRTSVSVFLGAVRTWEDRKRRYAEQQVQAMLEKTQRGAHGGTT